MKISFIGAGRAGGSLGIYFKEKGMDVLGYYSKSAQSAINASLNIDGIAFTHIKDALFADIIIISVQDSAIRKVSEDISEYNLEGKHILHLSGAYSSEILSACSRMGAYVYSLHPPFVFDSQRTKISDITFTLEGDNTELLSSYLNAHNIKHIKISSKDKPLYHASAVMGSNYITTLLSVVFKMLSDCGFSDAESRSFFKPLINSAVEASIEKGAKDALTGPIKRGDVQTIMLHLDTIKDDKIKSLYKTLGLIALDLTDHDKETKSKILEVLK